MLYVLKTDGTEPKELIQEISKGQVDHSVFLSRISLLDEQYGLNEK